MRGCEDWGSVAIGKEVSNLSVLGVASSWFFLGHRYFFLSLILRFLEMYIRFGSKLSASNIAHFFLLNLNLFRKVHLAWRYAHFGSKHLNLAMILFPLTTWIEQVDRS